MKKPERVLVSGAAVSGCACALLLAREGIRVDIYDLRDESGTEGGGSAPRALHPNEHQERAVSLFPNGSRILKTLGLLEQLIKQGWTSQEVKHMTDNNQILATTPGHVKGCSTLRIRRHHLLTALRKACSQQKGITAHWRQKVKSFKQTGDQVKLVFDDETESPAADLLIAADGVHSRIRQQLYPESVAQYMGRCLIGGYVGKTDWRPWPDDALVYSQHGFIGGLGIDEDTISWFADTVVEDRGRGWNDFKESGGAAKIVKEAYKGWPEPVATIIKDLEASNTFLWPHYRVPPIKDWVNGRIVIMGDAAHALAPPAAQGGSQALEDAQLLALCLSRGIELKFWETQRRQRLAIVTSTTDKAIFLRRMSIYGGWVGFLLKKVVIKWITTTTGVLNTLNLIYGYDVADLELPISSKL